MKRMTFNTIGLIAAVFALLLVAVAPVSAAQQVPLNAGFEGGIQITGIGPNGPTAAVYSGEGAGTLLGEAHMQGEISIVGPGPAGCEFGFTATHTDTLTAANGDQLVVEVTETSCPRAASPNIYDCAGTYSVVGGTGHFATATGSGTWEGVVTFGPDGSGTFNSAYSGLISKGQ